MQASPVLYARGPYRVVTDAGEPPHDLYVVIDTAGAWLREAPSFEAARAWVDDRVAELETPRRRGAPRVR